MNVLQVNAVNVIKSTGRNVIELDKYLINNGHESVVAYSESPYSSGYKIGGKIGKELHGILSRITGLQGYFSSKSTRKLVKLISKLQPDIVHVHNLHGNYINMRILFDYLGKNNVPTVITLHDCWFFTGGHTHYTTDNYFDWRDGFSKENRDKKKMGNPSWFFDKSEKIFNDQIKWFSKIPRLAFVGVSKWISEESKKSKVTEGAQIHTIYNWVDLEIYRPLSNPNLKVKLNLKDKFVILGVASGWSNTKGFDKFVELSTKLTNDECILLIGKIDRNIELSDNIIHIPETHNMQELAEYYSLADVFVNLSLEESFGKVTAEALACGTPIITNNSTANPELVGKGCGYITDSFEDIRRSLDKIKLNGKEYYLKSCVQFAEENFESRERMNDYISLYRGLIESEVRK